VLKNGTSCNWRILNVMWIIERDCRVNLKEVERVSEKLNWRG
jgi:hypothetical protein